jgi:hypothetical protein
VLSGMERWIWKLCQDGMLLHTCVLCRGVLGMYLKVTWVVGIPSITIILGFSNWIFKPKSTPK